MRGKFAWLTATMLIGGPALAQQEPQPKVVSTPDWVIASKIVAPDPTQSSAPFQTLLSNNQTRFYSDHVDNYLEYVVIPQSTAGLQATGNVILPWNVERGDLFLHRVEIQRGSETINLLEKPELMVLRRENNLEMAVLDGVRTVVLPAKGLQAGDTLTVAASYTLRAGIGARVPEEFKLWNAAIPVRHYEARFLVPDGMQVRHAASAIVPKPRISRKNGFTEYVFAADDVKFEPVPANAPGRFKIQAIQFSAYRDWAQVADEMRSPYQTSKVLRPGSPLLAEADRIAASTPDPAKRMQAALRLAQEKVRYVALALGEGAYVPTPADETWSRKFGDCKDKTALLLALLDRLGIAAEPMLVSVGADDGMNERLPSLLMFDHVLVRAQVEGKTYYLDATSFGQRALEELSRSPLKWGLPLKAGAALERLNQPLPTRPTFESELVWGASKGFNDRVPFTSRLTLRGETAWLMRALMAASTDGKLLDERLKAMMPGVADKDLNIVEKIPEASDGSFVIRFDGKAAMDWTPVEGKRGRRFQFDQDPVSWKAGLTRESGMWKDLPVALNSKRWEQHTESVVLPLGGRDFTIEASAFQKSLPGAEIRRTVGRSGDRVTIVSSFRFNKDEISAAEAEVAAAARKASNDDYAYVVAPDNYVMTSAERKSILSDSAQGYDEWLRRGMLELDERRYRQAVKSLEKASAANVEAAAPYAAKALALANLNDLAGAAAAIAKASSIDAKADGLEEARAHVAWLKHDVPAALAAIDETLKSEPDNVRAMQFKASLLASDGKLTEALAEARRAYRIAEGEYGADLIARLQAMSGNLDGAMATIDGAIAERPEDAAFLHTLKGDLLFSEGRLSEASKAYSTAASGSLGQELQRNAQGSGHDPSQYQESFEQAVLQLTRQYDRLETQLSKEIASKKYPSASHYMNRAHYRLLQGKLDGADADARNALAVEPDNSLANMVAGLVALRRDRFGPAETHLTKAIALRPTEAQLYYARGLARKKLGKMAAAEQDLRWARELQFDVARDPLIVAAGVKVD